MTYDIQCIVMGISAGGFNALHAILPLFPSDFPVPIIIVQHRMPGEDDFLVASLDSKCPLQVREAQDGEAIENGKIYIAPGGYHLLVNRNKRFSLSLDEPVSYARPSIDVLFETAVWAFGHHLAGVILTGANSDGSNGIKMIKENNGLTIAQDPETAESKAMPLSAIATKCIDFVLPLPDIPLFLTTLLEDRHE